MILGVPLVWLKINQRPLQIFPPCELAQVVRDTGCREAVQCHTPGESSEDRTKRLQDACAQLEVKPKGRLVEC